MEELDTGAALAREDLFALFRQQLKKDFETAGVDSTFIHTLPAELPDLKDCLMRALEPLLRSGPNLLAGLLYRVDISETQLKNYGRDHADLRFEEIVAELIIKRVLQKIILRKKFSE